MTTSARASRDELLHAMATLMGFEGAAALAQTDAAALFESLVDAALDSHDGDALLALETLGSEAPWSWVPDAVGATTPAPAAIAATRGADLPATTRPVNDDSLGPLSAEETGRYRGKGDDDPKEIGRGGMGRVLALVDQHLDREVAVKELKDPRRGLGGAPSNAELRFVNEARIAGQLEHPSIVPVHELGRRSDGSLYYTMKLVRGRALHVAIRQAGGLAGRLELLGHFLDLCQAIAYAHDSRVIHRDIKPANVMIGSFGETAVLDWGLAKVLGAPELLSSGEEPDAATSSTSTSSPSSNRPISGVPSSHTQYGQALGTPSYMSPEQAEGRLEQVGPESDVWGLGAVLYTLLTGKPPFTGASVAETLEAVRSKPVVPVLEVEPEAPRELAAICERALRRDITQRYPNAQALAAEVDAYLKGLRVGTYNYSSMELLRRFIARNKALTATVATALVAVVVGAVLIFDAWRSADAERERADTKATEALASAEAETKAKLEALASAEAETKAKLEARDESTKAHASLAVAYAEKARTLLEERYASGATVMAAAALNESPLNPNGPHFRGGKLSFEDSLNLMELQSLFNTSSRRMLWQFERLLEVPQSISTWDVAPGGQHVLLQVRGAEAWIFNLDTGKRGRLIRVLGVASGRISWIDATTIVRITRRNTLSIEDAFTGEVRRDIPGPMGDQILKSVRVSPDRRRLAVATQNALQLHAIEDMKVLHKAPIHDPWGMAWSPDGRWLVLPTKPMVMVDVARLLASPGTSPPKEVRWSGLPDAVRLAFSKDGRHMATSDMQGTVSVWDMSSGKKVQTWPNAGSIPGGLAFDGDKLLFASKGATGIEVRRIVDGTLIHRAQVHDRPMYGLEFVGDRLLTIGLMDFGVAVWRRRPVAELKLGPVPAATVTSGVDGPGGTVFVGTSSGSVEVLPSSPGKSAPRRAYRPKKGVPHRGLLGVAVSPTRGEVAALDEVGTLTMWSPNGEVTLHVPGEKKDWYRHLLRFSKTGDTLWHWTNYTPSLLQWRTSDGKLVNEIAVSDAAGALVLTKDETTIITGDSAGDMSWLQVSDGAPQRTVSTGSPVHALQLSSDSMRLAWCNDTHVGVVDASTGAAKWQRPLAATSLQSALTWGRSDDTVCLLRNVSSLVCLNAATGEPMEKFTVPGATGLTWQRASDGMFFTPAGRFVEAVLPGRVTASRDSSELLEKASGDAHLSLNNYRLRSKAVGLQRHQQVVKATTSKGAPASAITGVKWSNHRPVGDGVVHLIDATNGAILSSDKRASSSFILIPPKNPPRLGIRYDAFGERTWNFSVSNRPGLRDRGVGVASVAEERTVLRGASIAAPAGRALIYGWVQHGRFSHGKDRTGVSCSTVSAAPSGTVVYTTEHYVPHEAPTDQSGTFIIPDAPPDKPITLTATVGGKSESVRLPPLGADTVTYLDIPFLLDKHPKHPSPKTCKPAAADNEKPSKQ